MLMHSIDVMCKGHTFDCILLKACTVRYGAGHSGRFLIIVLTRLLGSRL